MEIIKVRDLWKSYAGRAVVSGIDLSVSEGEIFGILGPNGAGKTTTVEMIGGLRPRDRGDVRVAGFDPAAGDRELRELLGCSFRSRGNRRRSPCGSRSSSIARSIAHPGRLTNCWPGLG